VPRRSQRLMLLRLVVVSHHRTAAVAVLIAGSMHAPVLPWASGAVMAPMSGTPAIINSQAPSQLHGRHPTRASGLCVHHCRRRGVRHDCGSYADGVLTANMPTLHPTRLSMTSFPPFEPARSPGTGDPRSSPATSSGRCPRAACAARRAPAPAAAAAAECRRRKPTAAASAATYLCMRLRSPGLSLDVS